MECVMPNSSTRLAVEYLPISMLRPWPSNARVHSKKQIHQIASSIREFGFTNPVLIDSDKTIVAGHGRVEAARLLGLSQVPAICLEQPERRADRTGAGIPRRTQQEA